MKRVIAILFACLLLTGCTSSPALSSDTVQESTVSADVMELHYADQFAVHYLSDGCAAIDIADGQKFLLVPEHGQIPENTENRVILQQPLKNLYVAASSAVDLFDGIGCLDSIHMISTKDWSLPAVQEALDNGKLQYIGKYSAPDYEQLLENGCGLAVESTMIYHTPETKEQLEALGIPVLVERSSYESHPLGRMEWLRLYGLLLGKSAEADAYFEEKTAGFREISAAQTMDGKRPTVAFFYISPNGYVNVRKPGDYISAMIEMAGGQYCLSAESLRVEENALSTMNIQMESFYALAKDADILIYNATVDGELDTMEELLRKDAMLADFKAVQNGKVWCSEQDMFQQTTGAADLLCDLHNIITENGEPLSFLHRLR